MTKSKSDIENLLRPRYKVIADYQNSIHRIGDIILTEPEAPFDRIAYYRCGEYPNIFKPLQWWEEREASEMPEYVKEYEPLEGGGGITYVYKNRKDFKYLTRAHIIGLKMTNDKRMIHLQYLQPATLDEYNQYIDKNK